jgi:hypothetical protein
MFNIKLLNEMLKMETMREEARRPVQVRSADHGELFTANPRQGSDAGQQPRNYEATIVSTRLYPDGAGVFKHQNAVQNPPPTWTCHSFIFLRFTCT